MNARRVVVAAVLLLAAFIGSGGTAAGQQPAPAVVPDLSGGWLRLDERVGELRRDRCEAPAGRADGRRPGDGGTRRRPECDSGGRRHRPGESGRPGVHRQQRRVHARRHGRQRDQSEFDRHVPPAVEGRSPDGSRGPRRPALPHGWPRASRPGEVHAEHVRPLDRSVRGKRADRRDGRPVGGQRAREVESAGPKHASPSGSNLRPTASVSRSPTRGTIRGSTFAPTRISTSSSGFPRTAMHWRRGVIRAIPFSVSRSFRRNRCSR